MVYCGCYGLLKSEKTMMFRKLKIEAMVITDSHSILSHPNRHSHASMFSNMARHGSRASCEARFGKSIGTQQEARRDDVPGWRAI